jgi:hypothetical protein
MEEKRADRNKKREIEFGAIFALIGVFIFIVIVSFAYSENKVSTQQECLNQEKFKYDNKCMAWEDWSILPYSAQETVMLEIADEISSTRGISQEQALLEILGVIESYSR